MKLPRLIGALLAGTASFHLAFAHPQLSFLIVVYFAALFELTRLSRARDAFYAGLVLGLMVFVPKLAFFYTLFDVGAAALWLILAFWHALFAGLAWRIREEFKLSCALVLIAACWAGIEFFRSELYPLRFSWLAGGYAFAQQPGFLLAWLGVYGVGFALFWWASVITSMSGRPRVWAAVASMALLYLLQQIPPQVKSGAHRTVDLAGIQLEFPVELEVPAKLDLLKRKHPGADLFVLSEYAFDGPVPFRVRK